MSIVDKIKIAWNQRMSRTSTHLDLDNWLVNYDAFMKKYEEIILRHCSFKNKSIIDYGIGGGWVARYLYENKGIIKYTGFDIAERVLKEAKNNLKKYANSSTFILVNETPDFSKYNADIFLCLAVIQHMPTLEYVSDFFKAMNNSGIEKLVFSIRAGIEVKFNPNMYKTTHDISQANKLTLEWCSEKLSHYEVDYYSEIDTANQEYMIYRKKK